MKEADTRETLDRLRCTSPGCDHKHGSRFYLVPPCHRVAGLMVTYDQETGELALACHRCKKPVGQIAVAA